MEKYYVVESRKGDEWILDKTESLSDAIKFARFEWGNLTRKERGNTTVEIRQYEDDIENEDCTNFDYDTFDWGYIIRDREAGNMIETLPTENEAADKLTEYILSDEKEECDTEEDDVYKLKERREALMSFYEIWDPATESSLSIYWDLNDDCVCTC